MAIDLPSSLVRKFVDLTTQEKESTGHYVYGTAIVNGDNKYVQLDGSDSITTVSIASDIETGDRVLVYIEDHTASVIGNITCPASGRGAIDVSNMLKDFEDLVVGDLYAIDASIEYIYTNYVSTGYLEANYITGEYIVAHYLLADTASLTYATIDSLTALEAYVYSLEASEITVEYLEANFADLTSFNALSGYVSNLAASMITTDYLEANYATLGDLEVVNGYILNLDSDYANIKNLLAGNAGVGDLQTIYLTSDNVVIQNALIEDAAIANVSADKITAGTIYTARVRIQTDENDESLYMDNSLIQMSDETRVRLQAGKDATGLYNFYIWNENGDIMFDALGATADGIGTEVIVNTHVADNANIAGYKLDIASVAECLNEDGSITVTAAQVSIGNTSLSAWYTEMTSLTTELGNSLTAIETEFTVIQGQIEEAVRQTEILEGEITTISDNYAQIVVDLGTVTTEVSSLTTEYNNLTGEYNSLVSEVASITTNVNNITIEVSSLTSDYNSLSSDVASITTSVNNISIDVSSLTTNYGTLSSQVASINTDISSITASVSSVQETLNNLSIGGRNYCLNTRELTAKTGETSIGSSWSYYGLDENGYGVILGDATKAANNYVVFYTDVDATTDVFNSQDMIFSIDLYAPNATSLPRGYAVLFSVYGSNNGTSWSRRLYKTYYLNTTSDGTVINTGDIVDNEWFRLIIKFKPPSTTNESSWSGSGGLSSYSIVKYAAEFGLRADNTVSDPIYIRKPKLELGTVATDWSPAPEDNDVSEESVIEILKNNITLTTSSSSNGTASIILSVDGESEGTATVVTDARTAFANETSSITISAGTITLNGGTITAASGNFTIDSEGNVTMNGAQATNLTVTGDSSFHGDIHATTITLENSNSYFTFNEEEDDVYGTLSLKIYTINTNTGSNSTYEASSICLGSGGIFMDSGSITTTDVKPGNYGRASSGIYIEEGDVGIYSAGAISFSAIDGFSLYGEIGSGNLYLDNYAGTGETFYSAKSYGGYTICFGCGNTQPNRGIYDRVSNSWGFYLDSSNISHLRVSNVSGNWYTCGNIMIGYFWNVSFSTISVPSGYAPKTTVGAAAIARTSSSSAYYYGYICVDTSRNVTCYYYTSYPPSSPSTLSSSGIVYVTIIYQY